MEGEKEMVTAENYFRIMNIYNTKKSQFERADFCDEIGVTMTNSFTYKKIIDILTFFDCILLKPSLENRKSYKIIIDLKKLEKLLLSLNYYKKTDEFIHKCMWGSITP